MFNPLSQIKATQYIIAADYDLTKQTRPITQVAVLSAGNSTQFVIRSLRQVITAMQLTLTCYPDIPVTIPNIPGLHDNPFEVAFINDQEQLYTTAVYLYPPNNPITITTKQQETDIEYIHQLEPILSEVKQWYADDEY